MCQSVQLLLLESTKRNKLAAGKELIQICQEAAMSNEPQVQTHATWQSSGISYLRASKLSEHLKQVLCGCTSAQADS